MRRLASTLAVCVTFAAILTACDVTNRQLPKRAPATPAERVLVVINDRSALGDSVGRYYAAQRGIDPSHIVRVRITTDDEIGEISFQLELVTAVRSAIAALPVRIDFILLTPGVPIRVAHKNGYSVDALLAGTNLPFKPMVGLDTAWLQKNRNPYFNATGPFDSDRYGMYLVTRLACGVPDDCFALVDRATRAMPVRGPFFFDAAPPRAVSDGYSYMNSTLFNAATALQRVGALVHMDSTASFVAPGEPVMGYASWGSNDSRFDSAAYHAVRFLPGALAETFVSTSARTFGPATGGQSRIVDLIAQGATGVKGYVSEPYTVALADPRILFDRYIRGATLAEAFYAASRMVLWKDLVVGDPLCAPYAVQRVPPGPVP